MNLDLDDNRYFQAEVKVERNRIQFTVLPVCHNNIFFNFTLFSMLSLPTFTTSSSCLLTSLIKLLASLRNTSGAIFGTRSLYSPISQRMLARAIGTVILSTMRAMWLIMPLCSLGCECRTR